MDEYDYIIVGSGLRWRRAGGAAERRTRPTRSCCWRRAPAAIPTPACRCLVRPADRASDRELVLPVRARAGQANRTSRCRVENFWAAKLDQRPGLGARPAARSSTPGRRWVAAAGAGTTWRRSSPASRTSSTATAATAAARRGPLKSLDRARPEPALRRAVRHLKAAGFKLNPDTTARTRKASSRPRPRSTRAGA